MRTVDHLLAMLRCNVFAVVLLTPVLALAQTQIEYIDINRFIVEGHRLLSPDEFVEVLNPFIGKHREPYDVQRAIEALRQRYRSDGISIGGVIASEQNSERGEVTLRIIDERIGKLTVEGLPLGGDENILSNQPEPRKKASLKAGEVSPNVQPDKQNAANIDPAQPEHFDINSFLIEGNTLLQPDVIEAAVKPFSGKNRDYGEVQHAVEAVKLRYSAAGFNIAGMIVSELDFARGIVTLQIIETRTGRFNKEGYRNGDDANIRTKLLVNSKEVSTGVDQVPTKVQLAKAAPSNPDQGLPIRFDINYFKIEGNTLLKPDDIEATLKLFTGKSRDYGDVQRAIIILRQRYISKGFSAVWVSAPEQDIGRGTVTLKVTEGKIGRITIEGNLFFDEANIRASLPALREGISPRAGDISANTQLANENPAKQVDVVLRTGEKPGVVDAVVNVIDVQPLKTFLTFDNTGNSQTGDFRVGVGVQHANLFDLDDVATFNYVTSPGKWNLVSLYSGSYRLPLYSRGDSLDLIAAYSDVSAGTTQTVAGPLNFSGKGAVYGLRYNQLLERRGDYSHQIVYGLDYRAYKNDCTLGNFGAAGCGPAGVDITVRPISLAYSGKWEQPGRIADFNASLARNIPGGNNGHERDFNAARPSPNGGNGAPSSYSIFRFGATLVNEFENNWQIRAAFNAQYTPDALVSGEQFGIAGATAVRGFLEREFTRDSGYFANLELYSPNLSKLLTGEGSLRALVFYDAAKAGNNPLSGEAKQQVTISSTGAGLRWSIQRNFNMRLDLARVIDGGGSEQSGDVRGHISVYYGF